MGSVQDFGGKCPVCEKNTLVSDYYYRTGEEYLTCLYCGYAHSTKIKYNEQGQVIRETKHSIDLPCNDLVLAECSLDSSRQSEADFSGIFPVPADMTTEELYNYLNSPPSGTLRFVYLRRSDGTLQQVSYRLTEMTIENQHFQASDVCWEVQESGGYGVLRTEVNGIGHWYSLDENASITKIMEQLPEQERTSAFGVKFAERGKNPEFYGITGAEWCKRTVDDTVN